MLPSDSTLPNLFSHAFRCCAFAFTEAGLFLLLQHRWAAGGARGVCSWQQFLAVGSWHPAHFVVAATAVAALGDAAASPRGHASQIRLPPYIGASVSDVETQSLWPCHRLLNAEWKWSEPRRRDFLDVDRAFLRAIISLATAKGAATQQSTVVDWCFGRHRLLRRRGSRYVSVGDTN